MKLLKTLLLLALFVVGAPAVFAQEKEDPAVETPKESKDSADGKNGAEAEEDDAEDADEEEESEIDVLKRMFKDVDGVVGSVTLSEDDIKSYIKHSEAFEALMDENEELEDLIEDKGLKAAFDETVKHEKYLGWASERELDAADWLRKSIRINTFQVRNSMNSVDDETIKSLEEAKEMIEGLKGMMDEDEYKKAIDEMDDAIKGLKDMKEFGDSLPEPTESEAKLLEQYSEELNMQ